MIRFALLGCGRIGAMHARNLAKAPGAELSTIYDPVEAATAPLKERLGCRVAESPEDALRALGRVRACRDAIQGCGVPIQLGFNRRFDPGFRAAREARDSGEIGSLEQVLITSRDPGMAPRAYIAASGGIFRDMTIHDFDLARFMLDDEPAEVFATGSALVDPSIGPEFGDLDSVMIVMKTADGKLCHINNSRRASYGYDQRVELHGSAGMVRAENRKPHELQRFGAKATEVAEPYLNFFIERYAEAYTAEIAAFVASVRDGAPVQSTFDDGYRALVLAEAALASVRSGASVKVADIG